VTVDDVGGTYRKFILGWSIICFTFSLVLASVWLALKTTYMIQDIY